MSIFEKWHFWLWLFQSLTWFQQVKIWQHDDVLAIHAPCCSFQWLITNSNWTRKFSGQFIGQNPFWCSAPHKTFFATSHLQKIPNSVILFDVLYLHFASLHPSIHSLYCLSSITGHIYRQTTIHSPIHTITEWVLNLRCSHRRQANQLDMHSMV